jgi:hypothetical protein
VKAITHSPGRFGNTFWFTLFFLFLFMGIAEWVTRLEIFRAVLTPPKMGSQHYQLGHKLALLDAAVKSNGAIDCIIVGSSMVDVGFDPSAFKDAYLETTGREIHCFNFGLDASSAASTAALTKILVEDYRPRFLIFGTDPRDYAVPLQSRDPSAILDTPWIKYRSGQFSIEGWLLDHSYLQRYRQHLARLLRFQFEDTLWSEMVLNFPIMPDGFTPITKISTYVNDPPDPDDTSFEVVYYKQIFSPYEMIDENLEAMERILQYNGSETKVIVVEMPISDGLYYFFKSGEEDYNRFVDQVGNLAGYHQVPFWRTEPLDSIPDDGWSDYSHLNVKGAEIFSVWLGKQVGEAEAQGIFEPFNR